MLSLTLDSRSGRHQRLVRYGDRLSTCKSIIFLLSEKPTHRRRLLIPRRLQVRFVLHASIAKSMVSFYQESGRAGRDGEDADCVVFWRAGDASRLSTLGHGEFWTGGREKRESGLAQRATLFLADSDRFFVPVYEMIKFAEDLRGCRKQSFARAFASTHGNSTAFDATDSDDPCGHCDNVRLPSTRFLIPAQR